MSPALNIEIPSDKTSKGITVSTINVWKKFKNLSPVSDSLGSFWFHNLFSAVFNCVQVFFIFLSGIFPPSRALSVSQSRSLHLSLSLLLSLHQLLSLLPRSWSPLCCSLCILPLSSSSSLGPHGSSQSERQ